MIAVFLAYGVGAGFAIVELVRFAARKLGFRQRTSQLIESLRAFQAATDDDARQSVLLSAGMRTILLSAMILVTLAAACAVMALPLLYWELTVVQMTAYTAYLSVSALAWWRIGRPSN